jgi:hypothetical protein
LKIAEKLEFEGDEEGPADMMGAKKRDGEGGRGEGGGSWGDSWMEMDTGIDTGYICMGLGPFCPITIHSRP